VKFKKMIRPGDVIEMQVKLNERLADAFFLTARVTTGGKLAARFDFACTLAKIKH
jgi:3-hydroxyacyl-[acyl-carrier-protein] dehydratase